MFCPQGVTAVRWLSEINASAPPSDQTPNSAARPSLVVASKSRSVFSPRRVLDVFACFGRPDDGGETGVKDGGGGCLWACLFKVQMLRPRMCGTSQKWQRAGLFMGDVHKPRIILSLGAADRKVAF